MTRGFFGSMFGILVVLLLLLATLFNIWQSDRMERRQLEFNHRLDALEDVAEAGALAPQSTATARAPSGGIWGVPEPAYITQALQDPDNTLLRDPSNWLPPEAEMGGTLLMRLGSDPKGLNYLAENAADISKLQSFNTMNLVGRHLKDPSKYGPQLAYHLHVEDDHTSYTFKLREDVYWHEPAVDFTTGRFDWLKGKHQVTAHDMVFAMDMTTNDQVSGAAPARSYLTDLLDYEALDEFTFRIRFKKKLYSTWSTIIPGIYPVPEFLYAHDEDGKRYSAEIIGARFQDHWYNPNGIGNGPYRFVRYEPGVAIEMERDPRFPLGGNAHDKILFQILKDQTSWARKLRTKELHATYLQPAQIRSEVIEGTEDSPFKDGTIKSGEYWTHSYFYIGWNADKPWFGDKRVRRAMSHAFNADGLLEDVFMGLGERCTGPMPTFLPFYDKTLPPIPFDLEEAARLLEEAGWVDTNGNGLRDKEVDGRQVEFDFTLVVYGSSDEYVTLGNIYKEDLAQIGVKMNVQPLDWAVLLKRVDDREFDAITLAWVSGPDVDFYQIWHSSQADVPKGSNRVGFRNEEADRLITELREEFEYSERIRIANEFHQLVYDEQPYTFFYTRKRNYFWQSNLKNVWFQMTRPYPNPRPWYLTAPAAG